MKQTEIRIGNHLMCYWKAEDKFIARKIDGIMDNKVYFSIPDRGAFSIKSWTSEIDDANKFTKGIPLSEDCLKQLGAVPGERYELIVLVLPHHPTVAIGLLPDCVRIYIKGIYFERNNYYIHELQNLYFAITGKELEFNTSVLLPEVEE